MIAGSSAVRYHLLIPLLLYTIAGGLASWEMARMLGPTPHRHVESRQAAPASNS